MTQKPHNSDSQVIKLTGQLFKVSTTKDGGSRITLDVGYESLEAVQDLLKLNGMGETNLAIVICPYNGL